MRRKMLLSSPLAEKLYDNAAKALPIIDFHDHLSPAALASPAPVKNIAQIWVCADPYKHRALRILGTPERLITGDAADLDKFRVWYEALPALVGNPLYDWSMMELDMVFDTAYSPRISAEEAWDALNEKLRGMCYRDILRKFPIEYAAPCAGITDDLSGFDRAAGICPSLRGDNMLIPDAALIASLARLTDTAIPSLDAYLLAVAKRLKVFKSHGCRFTDHALDNGFVYIRDDGCNDERFRRLLNGEPLSPHDRAALSSCILKALLSLYARSGFTCQLHMGAQRTTSSRLRTLAGPAGGYAAAGSSMDVASLTQLLDDAEQSSAGLPRILLYNLDPADNAVMATLCGSYARDGVRALVSQGPAWWWCDHYKGIWDMLDTFMSHSVLSTFIGMTTDSRSPLSFVRHDYFRRVLCSFLAAKVEEGRLPEDPDVLTDLINKLCYRNAKEAIS